MRYKFSLIAALVVTLALPSVALAASRLVLPPWYHCNMPVKGACYTTCVDTQTGAIITVRVGKCP